MAGLGGWVLINGGGILVVQPIMREDRGENSSIGQITTL